MVSADLSGGIAVELPNVLLVAPLVRPPTLRVRDAPACSHVPQPSSERDTPTTHSRQPQPARPARTRSSSSSRLSEYALATADSLRATGFPARLSDAAADDADDDEEEDEEDKDDDDERFDDDDVPADRAEEVPRAGLLSVDVSSKRQPTWAPQDLHVMGRQLMPGK